jgi:SAM-dependent methyltransferase
MHPGEHELMARAEERHWWYLGLRDALRRCLAAIDPPLPPSPRVLDAGCGTGANLRFLGELLDPAYLAGFDASAEAVELARRKVPTAEVYVSDLCDPQLPAGPLDLVVSTDVLYIPGVERALGGLRRLAASLAPGGLLILNLPAYDWLYSEHDVAIHTRERYTARRVRMVLEGLGLRVDRLSYRLCLLFPAVVLARLPGMLRARPGDRSARSDLHAVPGKASNRLLFAVLRLENAWLARGVRLPWGSSVFAIGRKV